MDMILELLELDGKLTVDDIAKIVKKDPKDVDKAIKQYEKKGIIIKYKAVINHTRLPEDSNKVKALIEVKIAPERDLGFDRIAERLYRFPEVKSCYLVSGTYDLLLHVEGANLHVVAGFVAEKLATMKNVTGTTTHFLLKKYKEDGDVLQLLQRSRRLAVS